VLCLVVWAGPQEMGQYQEVYYQVLLVLILQVPSPAHPKKKKKQ